MHVKLDDVSFRYVSVAVCYKKGCKKISNSLQRVAVNTAILVVFRDVQPLPWFFVTVVIFRLIAHNIGLSFIV